MTLLLPAALIDGLFRFGADLKFIPLSLFLLSARAGRCHPSRSSLLNGRTAWSG